MFDSVCVCVYEREREREREMSCGYERYDPYCELSLLDSCIQFEWIKVFCTYSRSASCKSI